MKMGLFINNDRHHNIFKSKEEIKDKNQYYFRRDHLSELLKEQQKINESLYQSILELKRINQQQYGRQNMQWMEMGDQLREIKEKENQVVQKLFDLEIGNSELKRQFHHQQLSEQDWISQLKSIQESNNEFMELLKQYALTSEHIEKKIDEQITAQEHMNDQISKQAKAQIDVINRLENQEAISERVLRQMDHFRSVLFERTTYLSEKIENGFEFMTACVTQLMTGSDLPAMPTFMHLKEKKQKEDIN